jgi:hypothetical protein
MTGFLAQLSDQINSQFSLGENSDTSLNAVIDGQNVKYGKLGDFASKFDQSSQRKYVEEGYLRKDPYNTDPKQLEILMQEPSGSVLFKKRMFSSIAENFRPDFMDKDEKLYYKAMRILFQNKCRQNAALEKLSKIQKISAAVGNIDNQLVPIIITLTDQANSGSDSDFFGTFAKSDPFAQTKDVSNFTKVVDRLRKIYAYNTPNQNTTWITDTTNLFQSTIGQGTGVIEITNFTNLQTSVTNDIKSPGNFSLNIVDPYESMLITEYDIERALSDATNSFYNHKSFQFGQQAAEQVINDNQNRLNQLRGSRNASPISFKIAPDTLLGKRVTAIIDRQGVELKFIYDSSGGTGFPGLGGGGTSVKVAPEYLLNGEIAGYDGLDPGRHPTIGPDDNIRALFPDSEVGVFNKLVSAIFQKMALDANSRNAFQTTNDETNYARRKLRFAFSGQLIIQPMDAVHIYINTKSRYDTKLLSGLNNMFTGNGILQNLNKTIVDFKSSLFSPANIDMAAEKSAFVGAEFPTFLWSLIRSQFITEKEGTHIFGGLVDRATDNWSDGKFTVDVSGRDNSAYFEMGKVNFKPSVDSFNGVIYDPLTPFKTSFDTITSNAKDNTPELLNENKYLLGDGQQKALVKFKLGPAAGQPVTSENYIQDRSIDPISGLTTRVFYAPDGLVYKWKEGIGVFVQFGSSIDINAPDKVGNANTYKDPFAGQDVMNVISLLITGQPYNFATYWKTTANLYGFGKDPQSFQDSMHSFTTALSKDLTLNNTLWGNFIPFKSLVVDEQSFAKALQGQFRIVQKNTELDSQIDKLKDLNRKAQLFGATNIFSKYDSSRFSAEYLKLQSEQHVLAQQINSNVYTLDQEDQSFYTTVGADTSFDSDQFTQSTTGTNSAYSDKSRRQIRRQVNYLTRRMSYNVRANDDKNLFIVDDYYDKDFDIAAYNQALTDGLSLYNNEFNSVKDRITLAAELLNLEVFCDTQGHIRVRPPQYNKMPSSVFYRMMYLKQALKVQVFPKFLDDLFNSQINTLREKIEVSEDQIRLNCAVLGYVDDDSAQSFIISSNSATEATGDSFAFISDGDSGLISDIPGILQAANFDQRDASQNQSIQLFDSIKNQSTSNKDIFSNTRRYTIIRKSLQEQALQLNGTSVLNNLQFQINPTIDTLIKRIQSKTGQKINKDYFLTANDDANFAVELPENVNVDVFKVTKDLSKQITERQRALKLFYNAIKNSVEFKSLDDDPNVSNKLLASVNFGNQNIPEVYEHMIEDESYDDYGPGSGSRYVIKRAQIRSLQIYQAPPDFTMVEVQGTLNNFNPEGLPTGLNSFPQGGNGLTSAVAVDYDLWRQFGLRVQSPINVPFLSDPASQCAPYASMILSRARKNILRGTLTISGNEFMQPGEVIFLEDRGMLFYTTAVRHSVTVGNSFTTTLELAYGHTPGEYIPTTLDIIGKMIFNNRDIAGYAIQRQSNSGNESNLGAVLKSNVSSSVFNTGQEGEKINNYSSFNTQTINNILYIAAARLNENDNSNSAVLAKVELRIYHDDNNPIDADLQTFANSVIDVLTSPDSGPKQSYAIGQSFTNPAFDSKFVEVVLINMDDENDRRSPSQKALDASRNIVKEQNMSSTGTQADVIRIALFKNVVDCWIKFENIANQTVTGS